MGPARPPTSDEVLAARDITAERERRRHLCATGGRITFARANAMPIPKMFGSPVNFGLVCQLRPQTALYRQVMFAEMLMLRMLRAPLEPRWVTTFGLAPARCAP
jgi:hypothetical protein